MAIEKRTSRTTAEIKRLVARGQYEVDPRMVAEAMIRRGHWTRELCPPVSTRWPRNRGWRLTDDRRN